jgi:myosin heavy subunit
MELFYFLTGVIVSIVGVMIYNYSKLNRNVTSLLKENQILAKRNAEHNITIEAISNTLASDDYQTSNQIVTKFKDMEKKLKDFDTSLNTLAKKSNNDIDSVNNNIQELKSYVKEFTNLSTSNRGY